MKKARMYTSIGVLTALLLALFVVPLPHSVMCILEIQPRDAEPIYIDVQDGGRLQEVHVRPGQQVEPGQLLALLDNIDIELEIAELRGEYEQYEQQLANLNLQKYNDPEAGMEIPAVEEARDTMERRLKQKKRDLDRLRLVAPVAGTVLPPKATPKRGDSDGQLPQWSGTPLEPKNVGAILKEGVQFCQLGDPTKWEAILVIDQTDRNYVKVGQKVEIKLDELPHRTLRSEITDIAQSELEYAPEVLTTKSGGELPTTTDPETGAEQLQSTSYQARAPIDDPEGLLRLGLRGRAKIHADWIPLGVRMWRFVSHTFNFKL